MGKESENPLGNILPTGNVEVDTTIVSPPVVFPPVTMQIDLSDLEDVVQLANLPGGYSIQMEDDTISVELENNGNFNSHMQVLQNIMQLIYQKQGLREFTIISDNNHFSFEDEEEETKVDSFANCKMIKKFVGKAEKIKENDPLVLQQCDCYICFDPYKPKELKRVLPKCGHVFHKKCIDKWLKHKSSCPECRSELLEDVTLNKEDMEEYVQHKGTPTQTCSVLHVELFDEEEEEDDDYYGEKEKEEKEKEEKEKEEKDTT